MKKIYYFLIFLIFAILMVAGINYFTPLYNYFFQHDSIKRGDYLFDHFGKTIPDINEIVLTRGSEVITLLKVAPQNWVIKELNQFPADHKNIMQFLYLVEKFRVGHVIDAQPFDLKVLTIDFKTKNGTAERLLCGDLIAHPKQIGAIKVNSNPVGRYYATGKNKQVVAVAQALELLDNGRAPWVNKNFLNIEHIEKIQLKSKKNNFSATRQRPDTFFAITNRTKTNKLEQDRLNMYAQLWNQPISNEIDVISNLKSDSMAILTLTTFEGLKYTLNFYIHKNRIFYTINVYTSTNLTKIKHYRILTTNGETRNIPRYASEMEKKLKKEKMLNRWIFSIPNETFEFLISPFN